MVPITFISCTCRSTLKCIPIKTLFGIKEGGAALVFGGNLIENDFIHDGEPNAHRSIHYMACYFCYIPSPHASIHAHDKYPRVVDSPMCNRQSLLRLHCTKQSMKVSHTNTTRKLLLHTHGEMVETRNVNPHSPKLNDAEQEKYEVQ